MTNDEKMDELLRIAKEHGTRFDRLEAKDEELLSLILEERKLNTSRFSQMSKSIEDLRADVGKMNVNLSARIDLLSADMHGLSEESYKMNRRVARLEKKLLS
ncbi:MAG TPA: hypothetical protein VFX30_03215 [bacterium]|nr:hypothetical protein [bacterium]